MPTESTCWSVDASLNLDGTRSYLTKKVCTTRCGGSRLASARRSRRGSNGTNPESLWLPAAAELRSAWTGEAPVPTRACLAGQRLDCLHWVRRAGGVPASVAPVHVFRVGGPG